MAKRQGTFYKLLLILWKNLIIRKRQYIVTALEIILPTLFAILMAYIRTQLRDDSTFNSATIFSISDEKRLVDSARSAIRLFAYNPNSTSIVGFTPNIPEAEELVNRIEEYLRYDLETYDPEVFPDYESTKIEWKGFNNEKEIEAYVAEATLDSGYYNQPFKLALVFNGLNGNGNYPSNHKISYKIRMVDQFYETDELMPWLTIGGPEYQNVYRYENTGFSGFQIIIDKLLIEKLTKQPSNTFNISTQAFPYPEYAGFNFNQIYFILLPQFLVLGFIFIVPSIVRGIVSEKETGIKELMKMTGLPNWMHWFCWLLNSMMILIISITIVTVLFWVPFSSNGAVMNNSDPTLFWFILFLYSIWATSFCFLVSSIFERPTLATTFGIVIWLGCYYGVAFPLEPNYSTQSLGSKLLLCLCPNMGLHYALKVFSAYEAADSGARWKYVGDPVNAVDNLALWHIFVMFIVSSVVYSLLGLYLESIIPTKYGIRKPWYFIFLPETWGIKRNEKTVYEDISILKNKAVQAEQQNSFESSPTNLKLGMEILGLRKEFGDNKVAVKDVSLKMYEGQVFCLLGHNGAGKTTTMSILTGLLAPSSGTALVNGRDIRSEMTTIREDLGLCPQHNLLFTKLTVSEHLKFFGMVKGLSSSEANSQVPSLIQKLQLVEKTNELSSSLSGGQKRRLSLGCAIIGGSKILFLDECSSGLDPEARRIIWDLILEIREGRTIVLTTHFLEEADILGDRIGIMAAGEVQCCGSPTFLKQYYGTGYTLSLSLTPTSNPNLVLQAVQHYIPEAFIKSQESGQFTELAITLPSDGAATSKFPNLFSSLLNNKPLYGIQDLTISLTTMDEVFIKVDELNHSTDDGISTESSQNISGDDLTRPLSKRSSGFQLVVQQFWGLLCKKMLYSLRRWKLTAFQMILPVLLMIAAILITNISFDKKDRTPPLKMSLDDYKRQTVYYTTENNDWLGNNYASVVGSPARQLESSTNLTEYLLSIGNRDLDYYIKQHVVAAELNAINLTARFSTIPAHSCPLSINLVSNAVLKSFNHNGALEVINHPMSSNTREMFDAASPNPSFTEVGPFVVGILVSIGLSLLAASFIVMPVEERKCQSKQLQLMTGVNPILYWGSSLIWDYFLILICISVMIACLFIFEKYESFTNNGGAGTAFVIMAVYGFGSLCFSYIFSLISLSPAGGFAMLTIIHLITGTGFALGVFIMQDDVSLVGTSRIIGWLGRLFPTYGISKSLMTYIKTSTFNSRCNVVTQDIKNVLCKPGDEWMKMYQTCCDNCEDLGVDCYKPQPYLVWSFSETEGSSYYQTEKILPGIGQELLLMIIVSLAYSTILLLVEFGYAKRLVNMVFKQNDMTFTTVTNDDDVHNERDRVKTLLESGSTTQEAIVVENLCKNFGTFSAVSRLQFGVHPGECFGLLGVNGAGKTTSFRMLTGDEMISNGNAFIDKYSLQTDRKQFLSSIGYCPQFDGIIGVLSGKQMLKLFARLRGINSSMVEAEAQKWLAKMGLSESGDVRCQNYSGGMKRRLSAGMAMIGDPKIIFFDEPTSGVDPVSRRKFWNIISGLRSQGQSIILTSHSMEECEVLCSRLGIMVNGEMQCIGRVQHLRNKFAQGYTLTIRLKAESIVHQDETFLTSLTNTIISQYYPCSLKDHHQNMMQFHIESKQMGWDKLFETMERIKLDFGFGFYIEEYSIQQTTLEEVFLSFARKQYSDNRQVSVNRFRKAISFFTGY